MVTRTRSAPNGNTREVTEIESMGGDLSNSGEQAILTAAPAVCSVTIEGTSSMLFHRWQCDSIEAKAKAAKNSEAKKTDDVQSYVWRDPDGIICLPGEYLRGSIVDPRNGAAKYIPDPRSSRKSALDLYRAGVVALTDLGRITRADGSLAEDWDFLDRRRVTVQRAGITRVRPAFLPGWQATITLSILSPEYITPMSLHSVLANAGRLVGVGDFRPTFGRFAIVSFDVGLIDWRGVARRGQARRGRARLGLVGHGKARRGMGSGGRANRPLDRSVA